MLTIFSVPKPFVGHIGVIQRNALQSWSHLYPPCEIVLCGDELGIEEAAREFRTKWIPTLTRNDFGTPLLNSVFHQVREEASQRLLCYVNADIILLSDFLKAVRCIRFRKFLMAGQRWDMNIKGACDFNNPDWEGHLRAHLAKDGRLHPPAGSDYFVFPKDSDIGRFPPFAVGRPAWDNWLIYRARQLRIPVIDATKVVTVVHQNHDYAHMRKESDRRWKGSEADRNRELAGGWECVFTLLDATHLMTSKGVRPAFGYLYLKRRWQTLPILVRGIRPILRRIKGMGNRLGFRNHLTKEKAGIRQ